MYPPIVTANIPQAAPRGALSFDMTASDLSDSMAPVAGAGQLYVQFTYLRVQLSDGTYATRLAVFKQPRGDRATVAVRFISEAAAAKDFPQEFAFFKSTGEVPTHGTPLSDLPGISLAQIGLLLVNGIRSVEDLAALTGDQVGQIGIDAIQAHKVAKRWLENKAKNGDLTEGARREAALEQALIEANRRADEAQRAATDALAQVKVLTQMGGGAAHLAGQMAPGMAAAQAMSNGAIAVDGEKIEPIANVADPFLDGGGIADGNGDLGLDGGGEMNLTQDNPLGLPAKRKG